MYYFKTIKQGTKKAEELISNYGYFVNRYGYRNIWQAYQKPSLYKTRSWLAIVDFCYEMNGYGLSVLGTNCSKYSCGFKAIVNGEEKLFYFTADNSYEITL